MVAACQVMRNAAQMSATLADKRMPQVQQAAAQPRVQIRGCTVVSWGTQHQMTHDW